MNPWKVLSIEPTVELRAIKRAYAIQLKQHRPDVDPEGYQRVRDAFDHAKQIARNEASRQVDAEPVEVADTPPGGEVIGEAITEASVSEAEPASYTEVIQTQVKQTEAHEVEAPPRETIYINDQEAALDEQPEQDNEAPSNAIPGLINSIHDVLLEHGEVAAFNAFLETLDCAELIPIDASKQFELYLMDYLNWWAEKQYHDPNITVPEGMIRQIVKHFSWHNQTGNLGNQFPYLENIVSTTLINSGEAYLQKVANGTINTNAYHRNAAKNLLGKFHPWLFAIRALSPTRKKAIYELLANISNLKDGSFLFELNTETIRWWLESQNRFMLSGGMVLTGFFGAMPINFYFIENLLKSPDIANFLWPLIPVSVFIGSFILSIYLTHKIYYFGSLILDRIHNYLNSLSALTRECIAGLVSLVLVMIHYFTNKADQGLAGVVVVVMLLFFIGMYRIRTFILFFELLLMLFCYEMINGNLAHQQLTMTQIFLPMVIFHSLVFIAYLAWVKNRSGITNPDPGQGKTLLISSPALLLICIYSALIS